MNKKNNLNTKNLPPLFMLVAGAIALIICIVNGYEVRVLLLVLFLTLLVFAIFGTIIKSIVDNFKMNKNYDDLFDEDDDKW